MSVKLGDKTKDQFINPGYTAPEVFSSKDYSHKADVFSCGCILYGLLKG